MVCVAIFQEPARYVEIEGETFALNPKDESVDKANSFYDTVGKTQNVAHDTLRRRICISLDVNSEKYSYVHLFYCSKDHVGEEELQQLAKRGLDCIERSRVQFEKPAKEEITKCWELYTESAMKDKVKPLCLEEMETAAYMNRPITIYETNGRDNGASTIRATRGTRFGVDRKYDTETHHEEGDLVLIYDNGYYRSLAE